MNMLEFFQEIGKMKRMKRRGWVMNGVKEPESIAEHSFRTAIMTLFLGKGRKDLDLWKAVKMALIHDIAESKTGDIVVERKWKYGKHVPKEMFDRITDEEKHKLEEEAFRGFVKMIGDGGGEYLELWSEFEEGRTKEAVFVREIDKLELSLQALEYIVEDKGLKEKLMNYFIYSKERVKDPELVRLLEEIDSLRPKK